MEGPISVGVLTFLIDKEAHDDKINESLVLRRMDSIMDSICCWFSDSAHSHEDIMIVVRRMLLYCNILLSKYPDLSAEEIRTWIEING